MMSKKEIERWLETLPDDADVAIDDGGLMLVEINAEGSQGDAYIEVGGIPDDWDEEESPDDSISSGSVPVREEAVSDTKRVSGAVSDDAKSHLAIRSDLNRAIYAAVRDYRCSNMVDEDGNGYPLVDLLSNDPPADIGTGEMEMISLVDEIEEAVHKTSVQ